MNRTSIAVILIIAIIPSWLHGTIFEPDKNSRRESDSAGLSRASVPVQLRAEVRLNQVFYAAGKGISATVRVADASLINANNRGLLLSSPESKDVEAMPLMPTADPRVYVTANSLIVEPAAGTVEVKNFDGKLVLRPNEMFAALFVLTEGAGPNEESKGQVIADFGVMDDKNFRTASVRVEPRIALTEDEKQIPPGGKQIGTLAFRNGQMVQVPLDEVMVAPLDRQQLDEFLKETKGKILLDDAVPTHKAQPTWFLVQVDNASADVEHLPQMRALFDEKETLLASSPETLRIYALAMHYNLEGFRVALNPRLQYMDEPTTRDGRTYDTPCPRGAPSPAPPPIPRALLNAMSRGTSGTLSKSFTDPIFGMREAWAYLALWDKDVIRIPTAFLDMGFAPNYDFRGYPYDIFQRDLEGDRSGRDSAVGPPTVGNSFFGGRSWHGTGVVTIAGGILNNGYGAVGTGGQVVQPMLYRMGLRTYAFEIGRGIRLAVDDGAALINISAGYPCRVLSILGADDICSTGGRAIFCAKVTAVVAAAAALTCAAAAAAVGWIPFVGPGIVAVLCAAAVSAAAVVTAACWGLVLAGDIFRGPMEEGVQYAMDHGVPVVASAGNQIRPDTVGALASLIDFDNHNVDDWQIIPAVLPGVICVGAADAMAPYPNQHFFGIRVDIWAPIPSMYFHPPDLDSIGTVECQQIDSRFGGTSAAAPYITGIIAMMMAVNPNLNPHTPTLTDEQRRHITESIREMLVSTATPARDRRLAWTSLAMRDEVNNRRNLVNAYAAVKRAGRDVIPDTDHAGYDTSLGFDETGPESPTTVNAASDYGPVNGIILSIPSGASPGGIPFIDTDTFVWRTPTTPGVYDGGKVQLRLLRRDLYGDVRLNDQPGVLLSRDEFEELWEYTIPPLFESPTDRRGMPVLDRMGRPVYTEFRMQVAGFGPGSDNVYKIQFFAARRASLDAYPPDMFDNPGSENDDSAHAAPLGEGSFGWREATPRRPIEEGAYELTVPNLNFNRRDDEDWFSVRVPADWQPEFCDFCAPTLEIAAEPPSRTIQLTAYDSAGHAIRTGSSPLLLTCEDYMGNLPLTFSVRSASLGPANYGLRLRWSIPNAGLCTLARRLRDADSGGSGGGSANSPFPRLEYLLGSRDLECPTAPFPRPRDPSPVDQARGNAKPELYVVDWRGGGAFWLEGLVARGESLLLRLYDSDGYLRAQSATPDLVKELKLTVQPKQNVDTTSLMLEAAQLPAGYYFLSISHAKAKTKVYLTLPANAISDGSPSLEDYLKPGSRRAREVLLPLPPISNGMAQPRP